MGKQVSAARKGIVSSADEDDTILKNHMWRILDVSD
jgi:hypothetical protein